MTKTLYVNGTSLDKTTKEQWRDWVVSMLPDEISDDAIIDIGRLKLTTLKELHEALKRKAQP